MNVTDIVTEFGAYYLNHGQGRKDLKQLLYFKSETDELFTRVNTEDNVIRQGSASMNRLLQPFQKTWSPTGEITFEAHTINLYGQKIDFQDYPDELYRSWLGFLGNNNLDRKTWPFVRYIIEKHIVPKSIEDYELNEVFAGSYLAPPTPGTAGAAGTAMDGIKKIINDGITATTITPIVTGAFSADPATFCGEIEAFVEAIDIRDRDRVPMTIAMSPVLALRYKKGKQAKYNVNYFQADDLMNLMHFPHIKVKGYQSHAGSEKIWCTPIENAICGVRGANKRNILRVENVDRQVKIYSDWDKGVGFILHERLYTNDQDTV